MKYAPLQLGNETKPLWGGNDMLGYIYQLVRGFEQEHGVQPNLLYLSRFHSEHLKSAFDERFSLGQIMDMLQMEMITGPDRIIYPYSLNASQYRGAC